MRGVLLSVDQIARIIISFSWIYHGLFPKLIQVAPLERLMTASIGLSPEYSNLVTKLAGFGEIILGIAFYFLYRNKLVNLFNISAMLSLLVFVAIMQPPLLIEAFNPVTTNLPLIAFSLVLLKTNASEDLV